MKKSNSKKMGIKIKTNNKNDIYFFDNKDFKKDNQNYLMLSDEENKLIKKSNTAQFDFLDTNTNKKIDIIKGKNIIVEYENKYSISKENLLNQCLIKKYCYNGDISSNLVIQFIHNNEDIKKIVSLYVNDVIYSLSSINKDNYDVISKISPSFNMKNNKIYTNSGIYNNSDLYNILNNLRYRQTLYGLENKNKAILFEYLKAISSLRNLVAHFNKTDVYNLNLLKNELSNYILIKGKEFLKNSALNIDLITKLYSNKNINEEVKQYYLYVLNQKDKNIGLSIKKIMEIARNIYPSNIENEEKNKKYNVLLKYHLFNYLTNNKELTNEYIDKLRKSDYEDKDNIYYELVKKIGKEEFDRVKNIIDKIDFKEEVSINLKDIEKEILNVKYNWNYFILQIYALSKFLTIKETNVLTSSLINKFQSMLDLYYVSKSINFNIKDCIKTNYLICSIDEIEDVINQLRIINSSRRYINIKKSKCDERFVIDGLKIFKNNYNNNELKKLLNEKINNKIYKSKRIKNPLKNFIRNNVIKTKEFNYLIRYSDPGKLSNILYKNVNLVKFLFEQFTDSEKEKYKLNNVNEKTISEITLDEIIKNLKSGNMDYSINVKAYVKCIYFLIKNMVNINSYYFIAFSFYARDMMLINSDYKEYSLKLFNYVKSKDRDETRITIKNFNSIKDKNIFDRYRNIVEHININKLLYDTKFPDSFKYSNYFKIYHYCIQKELLNIEYNNIFLNECKSNINEYNKYSKNLLYVLNSIFIYNYARFKDLSVEEIFMRKYN